MLKSSRLEVMAALLFCSLAGGQTNIRRPIAGSAPPSGPTTVLHSCNDRQFQTTTSCSLTSPTAGNQLVVWQYVSDGTIGAPSGCASSWTSVASDTGGSLKQNIYKATATGGTCTLTFTTPDGSQVGGGFVVETDATSLTVEGTPAFLGLFGISFCSTGCVGPSTTTATNNTLILSFAVHDSPNSVDSPYTLIGSFSQIIGGYRYWTSQGSTSMTFNDTAAGTGSGAIVAFK